MTTSQKLKGYTFREIEDVYPIDIDGTQAYVSESGNVFFPEKGLGALDPVSTAVSVISNAFKVHNSKLSVDQFFKERDKVLDQLRKSGIPQSCLDQILAEDCLNHACLKTNYLKDYVPEYNKFLQVSVPKIMQCALNMGAITQTFYDAFFKTGSLTLSKQQDQTTNQQAPQSNSVQASAGSIFTPNVKTALLIAGGVVALSVLAYVTAVSHEKKNLGQFKSKKRK